MYLVNLCPFPVKANPVLYSWLGIAAVNRLGPERVCLLGSSLQLLPPSEQQHDAWVEEWTGERDDDAFARARRLTVPDDILQAAFNEAGDGLSLLRRCVAEGFQAYRAWLYERVGRLHAETRVVAAITHVNDAALEDVCSGLGIPVIHHEAGNARPPFFRVETMFLDFQGANGNAEAEARWRAEGARFRSKPARCGKVIDALLSPEAASIRWAGPAAEPRYEIGVPLQVEDDSNIVAYGRGLTGIDVLHRACHIFPPTQVLVREHPLSKFAYRSTVMGEKDDSIDSAEFLGKVRRVLTVNSSVGFEAVVLGVQTYVLGDAPFAYMAQKRLDRHVLLPPRERAETDAMAAFYLLGYLVPRQAWLDASYYEFRLGAPSPAQILRRHAAMYGQLPELDADPLLEFLASS